FPHGTIRPRLLQWRVQRDRHDGEGQQAIHAQQRLGILHLRPPSVAVRRGGSGVADQRMRWVPRRQRREDRYDLDSVLSAASRQGRLLGTAFQRRRRNMADMNMSKGTEMTASNGQGGHLYMQTNEIRNVIVHYRRSANGTLTEIERVGTGGCG